jgi:O-antigen/teichoic acid export membrane protein
MNPETAVAAGGNLPPTGTWKDPASADLRIRTIRGGAVTLFAQGVRVVLNLGSTVILARLLTPRDYGLIAMATAVTGFVEILRDGGLSLATIQSERITAEQISTLFWLNAGLGAGLTLVSLALAPLIAVFYGEPQLGWIAAALAASFLIGGLAVQHQALLRRDMRYTATAAIDILSMGGGIALAVMLAELGAGSWSLVGMTLGSIGLNTLAVWMTVRWRPGRFHSCASVRTMLGFGGSVLAIRFVHSFIRSTPSILLGWYWGAASVGLYQRAYALLMFAVDQIQGPITSVAIAPLSRLQHDLERLKRFFLSAYGIIVSAILPVMITCAVYAEEIVAILLGPQWAATAGIFRWLALAGTFIGLNHPQGMLLLAMGRANRSMHVALIDAVAIVIAYGVGLPFGAEGVAFCFFIAKALLCLPLTLVAFWDTPVSLRDVVDAVRAPFLIAVLAGTGGGLLKFLLLPRLGPWPLGFIGCAATLLAYAAGLLFWARKWAYYSAILQELRPKIVPVAPA